jgi:class 3 adenylate cyclase/tetratricopeptide (TPR) repeat protein
MKMRESDREREEPMAPGTIAEWLTKLGLPQYVALFEREQIDLDALPHVTDADLRNLKLPTGPRVKILAAARELESSRAAEASQPGPTTARPSSQPLSRRAERRQLTVMFCDLVGSTQLSQKLDPEALRELMTTYQQACGRVIDKYEGHVAQYLGDGVMAYFGWPRAHEDDAERAVRAGVELVDAVKRVPAPDTLRVRIGIATGSVVVGETGEGDASVPKAAVGETPNLASRLQSLASPDQIIVAPSTRRLLGTAFACAELEPQTLKGIVDTIAPFRVIGPTQVEGRFEAARGMSGFTPLVGREEELALLLRGWQQAKAGHGRVVFLSGEPGIGKSRLVRSLRESIGHEADTTLRLQCSPFHTQTALFPVIDHIERASGFAREDSAEDRLDKLETLLRKTASEEDFPGTAPLFAALLSLPLERYPSLHYSPQKQKERTLAVVAEYIARRAGKHPLCIVFEDIHWIDPTTQELLDLLIVKVTRLPALLLNTHRPEYRPRWTSEPHVIALTLPRLDRKLGAELVTCVSGQKRLPRAVLDEIVEKTDGVPLFVEELTRQVIESGLLKDDGDHYSLAGPLAAMQIPSTLRDSLMARLDRLGEAKEVAQICAVVGREFSQELIAEVSSLPHDSLAHALDELVDAQLIFRHGSPGAPSYVFKHALLQDAAYESVLKSVRRGFHQRVATAMEQKFPSETVVRPAFVAHHFTEAGLSEQAVRYWARAGHDALTRSANLEAISHFTKGLELLERLPASEWRQRQELDLWLGLSPAYIATRGFSTSDVEQAALKARELCEVLGNTEGAAYARMSKFAVHLVRAELPQAVLEAKAGLELSREIRDPQLQALFNFLIGDAYYWAGRFSASQSHLDQAVVPWDTPQAQTVTERSGVSAPCIARAYIAHIHLVCGFPERAQRAIGAAVQDALKLGHAQSAGHCLGLAGWLAVFARDAVAARSFADSAIEYCHEQGLAFWEPSAYLVDGWALVQEGRMAEGVERMNQGFAMRRAAGAHLVHSSFFPVLAESHIHSDQFDAAERLLMDGFKHIESSGERHSEAELHRMQARWLLRTGSDVEAAVSRFRRAIEVARSQEARLFELRATTDLVTLWHERGDQRGALRLLTPIYSWFTEGFDTKDLKEARALLNQLAGPDAA